MLLRLLDHAETLYIIKPSGLKFISENINNTIYLTILEHQKHRVERFLR